MTLYQIPADHSSFCHAIPPTRDERKVRHESQRNRQLFGTEALAQAAQTAFSEWRSGSVDGVNTDRNELRNRHTWKLRNR